MVYESDPTSLVPIRAELNEVNNQAELVVKTSNSDALTSILHILSSSIADDILGESPIVSLDLNYKFSY